MTQAPADSTQDDVFGPVIYRYTRAQALADGVLVDVGAMAQEAGFRYPIALTHAAWEDCVTWSDEDSQRKGVPQDVNGRLWDVLWMCHIGVRMAARSGQCALFRLYRVPREGRGRQALLTTLKCVIGPGDSGEPVLTVMLPNED